MPLEGWEENIPCTGVIRPKGNSNPAISRQHGGVASRRVGKVESGGISGGVEATGAGEGKRVVDGGRAS